MTTVKVLFLTKINATQTFDERHHLATGYLDRRVTAGS